MNNYTTYSDEELIPLLREDKPTCDYSFDVLFNRYGSKLFSYCLFLTRNRKDSDLVFHEAWLKFFQYVKSGKSVEKILPFLILTVKHIIVDNARKIIRESKNKSELMTLSDFNSGIEHTGSQHDKNEMLELIHIAVDSLDDVYKEAFILKRYQELPNEEIAAICNESVECIRKRVTRATNMVKKILEPYINEYNEK
ncbi:MAG: RNA polymerase sigma factor [Ignavibacteriae bacterium]|nr:RNA polymerase sigma factor [Ignavibacteriota bacterium]